MGFLGKSGLGPDAALFRKDSSIKPNGQVWKDLVLGKWWTRTDGHTAADGTYSTLRFPRRLRCECHDGKIRSQSSTFSLPHEGRPVDVVLK